MSTLPQTDANENLLVTPQFLAEAANQKNMFSPSLHSESVKQDLDKIEEDKNEEQGMTKA